jgi:predicted TIM-barrel fold metal-dependent hydrolase
MKPLLPIIDTDIHNTIAKAEDLFPYLSAYWREVVKTQGLPNPAGNYRSPFGVLRSDAIPSRGGPPGSDPDLLFQQLMEPGNITYGILTGADCMGLSICPDPDYGNAIASAMNDYTAATWLNYSDRFRGSILINHSDPAAAAKEINRVAKDKRFVQTIMPSASRSLFGTRFYHPIYEAAENHGLAVAVHPGAEGAGVTGPPTPSGYPTRYLEWRAALPLNYMAQISSLVCEGVFEKFPGLKFIGLEGGVSWLPQLMWRLDKDYKALRSTVPWLKRLPSEYILENVRLSTQPVEEPPEPSDLAEMYRMAGAEKIVMFSSDYPHWDNDDPHHNALNHLPEKMHRRIMWETAAECYGLKVEAPAPEHDHALSRL